MTDTPPLIRTQEGSISRVILNRPAQRNALSAGLLEKLRKAIEEMGADDSVHVGIIAANGSAFCAGHDLGELKSHRADADQGAAFFQNLFAACSDLMLAITQCPKPIIAEVQGIATAAGCQLVATCDLAVASKTARFATPGVHIGLFCSTPMVALTRSVGRKKSMEMLLTGDAISAEDAEKYGLINMAVDDSQLTQTVHELALKIADKSPHTIAIGKRVFHEQINLNLAQAYDKASNAMACNMLSEDAFEGIDAFLTKRTPVWRGV